MTFERPFYASQNRVACLEFNRMIPSEFKGPDPEANSWLACFSSSDDHNRRAQRELQRNPPYRHCSASIHVRHHRKTVATERHICATRTLPGPGAATLHPPRRGLGPPPLGICPHRCRHPMLSSARTVRTARQPIGPVENSIHRSRTWSQVNFRRTFASF
jgi:hypothetical protein